MSFAGRLTLAHPWFVGLAAAVVGGALWYARKQQIAAANDPAAQTAALQAKNDALISKINAGVASWSDTEHNLIQSGAALYEPLYFPDNTSTLQAPATYTPSIWDQIFGG